MEPGTLVTVTTSYPAQVTDISKGNSGPVCCVLSQLDVV